MLKYEDVTREVIGAAMEVHALMRNGFIERVYQNALEIELTSKGIEFKREFEIPIFYKGIKVGARRLDLLINNNICVELKAVISLEHDHLAQAINYLEATNLEVGLLINFGAPSLQFKRLQNKKYKPYHPKN